MGGKRETGSRILLLTKFLSPDMLNLRIFVFIVFISSVYPEARGVFPVLLNAGYRSDKLNNRLNARTGVKSVVYFLDYLNYW